MWRLIDGRYIIRLARVSIFKSLLESEFLSTIIQIGGVELMNQIKFVLMFIMQVFFFVAFTNAYAAPITVTPTGADLVVRQEGEFELFFDASKGGTISTYYDLLTDPGKSYNLATNIPGNSTRYNGLYIIMFKQEHNASTHEALSSNFRGTTGTINVVYNTSNKVLVNVTGNFPTSYKGPAFLYGAKYDIMYTIESDLETTGALIYIRSRIIFTQSITREMQIRNALGLAHRSGLTKYSQARPILKQGHNYTDNGKEDYLGAYINQTNVKVDPVMILHRDWSAADYILLISPPKAPECLIAWVDRGTHRYSAGQIVEIKHLLRMDQRNVTSYQSVESLSQAYRESDGGDFIGKPDSTIAPIIPLLLDE